MYGARLPKVWNLSMKKSPVLFILYIVFICCLQVIRSQNRCWGQSFSTPYQERLNYFEMNIAMVVK
jgi:hypothetical protein